MKDFSITGASLPDPISVTPAGMTDADPSLAPSARSFYDGANRSIRRGQIFHASTDTRRELDTFSRNELLRRIRWLRANVGFVKALIKNAAGLVGWMTPAVNTDDEDFNQAANASIEKYLMAKSIFDVSGKFNFKTAQRMLVERALTDGDLLTVFSENSSQHAAFAFYEAHQFSDPKNAKNNNWNEGIFTNRHGRHLRYGISDGKTITTVGSRDAHYFGFFDSVNHNRAHPPLAHGVNHGIDITEVWADVKHAIKSAALFGVVTEVDTGASPMKVGGLMEDYESTSITTDSGGVGSAKEVWGGGQMPKGNPGEKFKILNDNRPGPNQREFVLDLLHDISAGLGLPLEVVYRLINLNGQGVRFIMKVAKRWIEDKQLDLRIWCKRVVVYHLSKEIKLGNLPMPADEDWMDKIKFTPRADLTIDRNQSSQDLDEIEFGASTFEDFYASRGVGDWKQSFRQKFREQAEIEKLGVEFGIDPEKVFRPRRGSTAPPPAKETNQSKPQPNP